MMTDNCFFYVTYTPEGYFTLATKPTFSADRNFVIKGYRPSVKQKIFDTIRTELKKRGETCTVFRTDCGCDGLYSSDEGLRIIDGTYITFDETDYEQIILDTDIIGTEPILIGRNDAVQRAVRFLSACRCINNDMARLEAKNIDTAKANRYAARLWSQAGGIMKGCIGTEHKRFITCITSDGVELDTAAFGMCERVTVISDRTGACARHITDRVRRYALSAGYDVISCLCPLNVELGAEHIIIPDLRYGIFVNKYHHKADLYPCRKTFSERFMTDGTDNKNRIDFSFKAYKRLMQEVFSSLETVEYCDSELDKIPNRNNNEEIIGNFMKTLFLC